MTITPAPSDRTPSPGTPEKKVDLAGLAAAVRSIERGDNPAAPAPRGDAAAARRKRREAMAAEATALQAAEAAEATGVPVPAGAPGSPDAPEAAQAAGPDEGVTGPDADESDAGPADVPADRSADLSADASGDVSGASDEREPGNSSAERGGSGTAGQGPYGGPGAADSPAGQAGSGTRDHASQAGAVRVALDPAAVEAAGRVLAEGGAPGELAAVAVRALGEGAAEELRADPWLVLGFEGVRIGVEQADAFARAVLGAECGPGDERRIRALVGHLMERAAETGHTALPAPALRAVLAKHAVPDPDEAIRAAVEEGQLLVFGGESEDGDDGDPAEDAPDEASADEQAAVPVLFGLDRYALAEESLADGCVRLLRSFEGDTVDWEGAAAGAPSPSAAELIRTVAAHALVLHTGGEASRAEPAALVTAARAAGLRAYAAAYTENGRRRLAAEVGEGAALTVAGLLAGGRAPDGSLPVDLVAVLDAPQLSVEEAATLVEAVPDGARLVLSGDPYVLWSAGPGRAFADLLAAKVCPRVTSRTPDPGPIGELVSCVGEGELLRVDAPDKEVVVVPVHDPREAVHRAVQLVADSVPRAFGVPPEQTQVITAAHGGPAGTRALNAALKERLNPGPGQFAGFDPGDRVVHVPAPGRAFPGTVVGAEPDGLRLECEAGSVLVAREDVPATVRQGWALTCHQAAGMRWPAAVVVVPGDAGPVLSRSWVYTAFSRGGRHLSVVQGADQGLPQAVAGPAAAPRTTRLTTILTSTP